MRYLCIVCHRHLIFFKAFMSPPLCSMPSLHVAAEVLNHINATVTCLGRHDVKPQWLVGMAFKPSYSARDHHGHQHISDNRW
jgi:hypothetical protein